MTCFNETWRKVERFEGKDCFWEVSSAGRVRSIRKSTGATRVLKPTPTHKGYLRVSVKKSQGYRQESVHCMVAEAFLGHRPEGYQINHIDEDKTNNNVNNLEYVTCTQNNRHGTRILRAAAALSRAVNQIDPESAAIVRRFESMRSAEIKTGVAHQNIAKCCLGQRKSAGGFFWRYADDE